MRTRLLLALGALVVACNGADRPLGTMLDRPQFNVSAPAGFSGRIAFHSDRDGGGDQEIFIMNADGSELTQLTDNTADDGSPTWSPTGPEIAFHSSRDGDHEIFIMNADGTGVTQLTDNTSTEFLPVWSPNGKKFLFTSNADGDFEIYLMNVDGTGVTQLTDNAFFDFWPVWSPDGKRVAFFSERDGDAEIYVMNVDGTAVTQLTNNVFSEINPAWSPDGKQIAFASDRDGDFEIYVMKVDGTAVTRLTNNAFEDRLPVWSPDGKRLAFVSNRDGDLEIFIMNADGTRVTQLTNDVFDEFDPAWSSGTITSPTTQFHFVANGDFGSVNWFEVDPAGGFTFGSLSVSRGGPTTDPQTFLSYFVFQCDPFFSCNAVRDGFGLIPNRDLSGGGKSLSLRTNTTGNLNFNTFVGPTGLVSVDWRVNGLFTQSSSGTNQFSFPGFTQRSQGRFTSASANATGSIVEVPVGAPMQPDSSGIGTNHQVIIDIARTNAMADSGTQLDAAATGQPARTANADAVSLLPTGTVSNSPTQFHFVANGDFGSVNWFEFDPAGGFTFGSLSVSRGGPTTDPQTFLSYFVFRCDPFSCNAVRDGFGLIPNRDLSGGGSSLSLRTNTTGNLNFNTFVGPTGLVSVDWRVNGLFTQSSSGTNQFSFPGFTQRSQGRFTSASANATGSIVGAPIATTASGDIGTSHQTTIDFIRSPTGGGCVAPPDGLRAWWPGDGDVGDFIGRNHGIGTFNVYVMTPRGSPQTQLTDVPFYNARPDWSHDGKRITFTACRATDASCEIYVMNADGSAQTKLTDDFSVDHMSAWSPDDRKIAFSSERDGNFEIYVMNADGSNQIRLTHNAALDWQPSWSPDGSKITFESDREGNHEIYVMNADGSSPVNLTGHPGSDERPRWSPRGDKIAFDTDRDGDHEIYVMRSDGSEPTRLTHDPGFDYGPAWSPDGNTIAFTTDRDGNFEIYLTKPDGSGQNRVTDNPAWDADPAWTTGKGGAQPLAFASAQAHFAPAKVREGFSFGGGAGEVVFAPGTGIDELQQLTIDAWVKHNSLPPGRIQRYVTLNNEKAVLRYDGEVGPAQLHFYMRIDGQLQHIRVDNVLQVGVFHHVAGSYDGAVMRLYLDGVEVGNLAITGAVGAGGGVIFSSDNEGLDGLLDEIEIFDRALDASEVRAIFEAGEAGKCKNASGG